MDDVAFKRLLTPNRHGDQVFFRGDYTLNLYRGCNHGCIYCDSRSVCYHMEDFGRVRVKRDCLAALETELRQKKRPGVVCMGSASDAYNAREATLLVTRGALLLFRRYGFGIFLATKSGLIDRDADVFADIAQGAYACVAFSVTAVDAALASFLEPGAPPPERRFQAMERLARAGVCTGVWMNPMLPYITDTEPNIRAVLQRTAGAGGRFALCHFGMTLREGDREYFYAALDSDARFAAVRTRYAAAFGLSYLCPSPQAERLDALWRAECARLGLACTFEEINRLAGAAEPKQITLL